MSVNLDSLLFAMSAKTDSDYAKLQGLGRAMLVLETLATRPMRAKELAEALELKWTTAHRTLTNLREQGYLERDEGTGLYYIGLRLYYLGSSYLADLAILQMARPYVIAAADEAEATVQLVERDGMRSTVLMTVEAAPESIPQTIPGFHFPLHAGSRGHVLLAYAPSEFVEEYLRRPLESLTPKTLTDPKALRQQLRRIREQGWAETVGDIQETGAVSAPIRDATGSVIACVTFIVTTEAYKGARARLIDVALRTAAVISHALGWRSEASAPINAAQARRG